MVFSKIKEISNKALKGAVRSRDRLNKGMDTFFGKNAYRGSMVNSNNVRRKTSMGLTKRRARERVSLKPKKDKRRIF